MKGFEGSEEEWGRGRWGGDRERRHSCMMRRVGTYRESLTFLINVSTALRLHSRMRRRGFCRRQWFRFV